MAQEEKYKYLAKNIGLLTLSNFTTKLLSFFLVPLYTNILTTTEYGTYDLLNTTIGLLIPILTLNVLEAAFRFVMEKDADLNAIVTICMKYVWIGNGIILLGLLGNHFIRVSTIVDNYAICLFLMFLTQSLSSVVISYTRGIGHIAELSVSSVITSVVTIICNILFLAGFHWGISGYFVANIIGPLVQAIYLVIRTGFASHIKFKGKFKDKQKEILGYTKPMIANSIAWWVNNLSDRYIITYFLGLSVNGIYSVASKIPSILNIMQSIFAQAWTLSAVKDFDPEDKNGFFKNTYALYNTVMVIGCSGIILFDRVLAKFLYAKEFYDAWRYVPWLTLAIIFGSLSGYLGGFFSAVKNSKIYAHSTVIGAVSNIVLNLILTPNIGASGAAIATAICYFVVFVIRLVHSKKIIKLRIDYARDFVSYVILVVQSVVLLVINNEGIMLYGIEGVLFLLTIILYRKESIKVIRRVLKR